MGLKYSIIDQNFLKKKKIRFNNNIFVAFGGGEDLEYIKKIKDIFKINDDKKFWICTNNRATVVFLNKLKIQNIKVFYKQKSIYNILLKCNQAIISLGTLSFETYFAGIKANLISINKIQRNNIELWRKKGFVYLGDISNKQIVIKNFQKSKKKKEIFKPIRNDYLKICNDAIRFIK